MKVVDLAPLKISDAYFGAGPGCGGVMEFVITHTKGVFCAKYNIDITEPTEEWHILSGIDENADWRSIIKPMEDEGVASLDIEDGTPPSAFEVTGKLNFAKELVVCACTGGSTLRAVHELMLLDDDVLANLRKKYSSFLTGDFQSELLELMEKADETSLPLSSLLKRNPDLEAASVDLDQFLLVEDAETEAARLRKEWAVGPFREQIDRVMASWRKAHPETSTNQAIGVRATSFGIRAFLENYVAANFQMPKGTHEFEIKLLGNPRKLKIDFDELTKPK